MKKLIQVLIVCGLIVVMGGTASGEEDEKIFMTGNESLDKILGDTGCILCHTIGEFPGGELGPILNKKSAEHALKDPNYKGQAKNSKEYIIESIVDSELYLTVDQKTNEEYMGGLMPNYYKQQLSDKALNKIADYILGSKTMTDKQVFQIYLEKAKDGNLEAHMQIASMYEKGKGTKKDIEQAKKHYMSAAKGGDAYGYWNLGEIYLGEYDYKNAVKSYFKTLSTQDKDFEGIVTNRMKKIKLKNIKDMAHTAYDEKDYKKALEIYSAFAEQGDEISQMRLGAMYQDGIGVSPDYKKAVKWHLLAAKQGNDYSQFQLGMLYAQGKGVEENEKEAVNWWKKASNQGMGLASYNVGIIYANENNLVEAEKYYNIALKQGYEQAKVKLENIKKLRKAEKEERKRAAKKEKEEWTLVHACSDGNSKVKRTGKEWRVLAKVDKNSKTGQWTTVITTQDRTEILHAYTYKLCKDGHGEIMPALMGS